MAPLHATFGGHILNAQLYEFVGTHFACVFVSVCPQFNCKDIDF